jgi:MFS family permease
MRDFHLLSISNLLSSVGFVGEMVIFGWVVLNRTDSTFMVGLALSVRMAPMFIFGIPAGAIADRFDRRLMLRLLSLITVFVALLFAGLMLNQDFDLWKLLLLLALSGTLQASLTTVRQTFVYDIVGKSKIVRGLALVNLFTRLGGIVGSLTAGAALAHWGSSASFMILAGFNAGALFFTFFIKYRGQAAPPQPTGSIWITFIETFKELKHNRVLLALVGLIAGVEILGFSNMAVMPTIARDVLGLGPDGLGMLNAFRGVGGVVGVLILARIGDIQRKGLLFISILPLFGFAIVVLGFTSSYLWALLVVAMISILAMMSDVLTQALIQLSVSNSLRGRAMGSWVLATGTAPIGHLQIGALASVTTVSFALTLNGLGLVILAFIVGMSVRKIRQL